MKEKKNIEFFNGELIDKYLMNEVNLVEKSEVEAWLNQSDENREELEHKRKMLAAVDDSYKAKKFDSFAAWNKVRSAIETPQQKVIQLNNVRKEVITQFYKYAAIIFVAVLMGSAVYYFGIRNNESVQYVEVVAAEKELVNEFVLPDGSTVALNSNSKLIFQKQFKGNTREVTIDGEAFFDVKPDAGKPFIINAGNAQVKVVGTSFNVSAYPESETVEVVVKTGKVQVISKNDPGMNNAGEVFLIPGEKGTLFNSSRILEKSENSNPNYLAWKTRDFIFNDVPLGEVVECLEKAYHVNILVPESDLNKLKLNAQFDKKPIEFILNVVGLTFNLDLSVDNEQYIFSSRKNN
jgi:ferric-dicitrate binding protein FerR (iron transport regulator)